MKVSVTENRVGSIVKRAQKGDRTAIDILVKTMMPIIESMSRNKIAFPYKEDISQHLWIRFFSFLNEYDPSRGPFLCTVKKILMFARHNYVRCQNKRSNHEIVTDVLPDIAGYNDRSALLEREEADRILRILAADPLDKAIIHLYGEGYKKQQEIANVLGISRSLVAKRLMNLRKRYRQNIGY